MINKIPIELWTIILLNCDIDSSMRFIKICASHRLLSNTDLKYLKKYYSYNYIINLSNLNKLIYQIYKDIEKINTYKKYQYYYSKFFDSLTYNCYKLNDYSNILTIVFYLREHLKQKIKNAKSKEKFKNITIRITKNINLNEKIGKNVKNMIELI